MGSQRRSSASCLLSVAGGRNDGGRLGVAKPIDSSLSTRSGSGAIAYVFTSLRDGLRWQRALVKQRGELLRREDPVALGHEFTDLLPVRAVGKQHPNAITAGPRGEEWPANGQIRLTVVWVGT